MTQQPNIIFLMADQLKYSATPFSGNSPLSLPYWEQMAAEGVCFDSAFSPTPICTPSRTTIMTGVRPEVHQVFCHQNYAPENLVQLPELLQAAGYATVGLGHYESQRGLTKGWDVQIDNTGTPALTAAMQSQYQAGSRTVGWSSGPHPLPPEESHAAQLTDLAIQVLDDQVVDDRPLFLHVAYIEPHVPYFYPKGFPLPVVPEDIDLPAWGDSAAEPAWWEQARRDFASHEASEEDIRRCIGAYYAMSAYLDQQMARLFDHLSASGFLENAWIILTSDHGDYTGEKGMFCKSESLYECLLHVPLVIRGPNGNWHSGERNNDLVELTDLFPTILSLAGQDPPEYVQGRDLVQWLDEDAEEPLRPALFSAVGEYHGHLKTTMPWGLPESGRHPSLVRAARTRKFVYIRDPDYGDEAYNLRTDPNELRNLFQLGDPLPPQVTVLSALLDEEIQSCERLKREIPVIPGKRNFDEPLPTTVIGSEGSVS